MDFLRIMYAFCYAGLYKTINQIIIIKYICKIIFIFKFLHELNNKSR